MKNPLQENRVICALEQYSFSDEAGQVVRAKHPQLQPQYVKNIGGVWDAVTNHGALGVIPFENSSGGVEWRHFDHLMNERAPLQIAASVRLKVRMCAGGKKGTELAGARAVYSHPKGLEQSSKFIAGLSADVSKIETASTVEGVKKVAEAIEVGSVALASRFAIESMGLKVLAEDVADLSGEQNVTKFFVVYKNGDQELPDVRRPYHAAIVTPKDKIGVLARMLNQISNCGMNLVSIHSRSVGDHEYAFFLDMERQGSEDEMDVLDQWLKRSSEIKSVKWLGSWDENDRN